jgi:pilus assembly protein CpaB
MRSLLPLILAVIVGAVTVKFGKDYLDKMQGRAEHASSSDGASSGGASAAAPAPVRQVLIATSDLPIGHALLNSDLQVMNAPLELVPEKCVHDIHAATGRVLTVAMSRGQMLNETLLAPIGTSEGLEATIPKGKRAFTVDVNEVSGLAGMIVPGSRVDVVATMTDQKTEESRTWTILQNAPVTAVGTRITQANPDSKDWLGNDRNGSGGQLVKTVTLLVTPEQAETLDLAYTRCKPRLVLRNLGEDDDHTSETGGITFSQLFHGPMAMGGAGNPVSSLLTRLAAAKRPGVDDGDQPIAGAAQTAPLSAAGAIASAQTAAVRRSVEVVRGGVSTMVYFESGDGNDSAGAAPGVEKKVDPFAPATNN